MHMAYVKRELIKKNLSYIIVIKILLAIVNIRAFKLILLLI